MHQTAKPRLISQEINNLKHLMVWSRNYLINMVIRIIVAIIPIFSYMFFVSDNLSQISCSPPNTLDAINCISYSNIRQEDMWSIHLVYFCFFLPGLVVFIYYMSKTLKESMRSPQRITRKAIEAYDKDNGLINTKNPEVVSFFNKLQKSSSKCNPSRMTSVNTFLLCMFSLLFYIIAFVPLTHTPVTELDWTFYLETGIFISLFSIPILLYHPRKLFHISRILSFKGIIEKFSSYVLKGQIIQYLEAFAHSQNNFDDETQFKGVLDEILRLLKEWEKFQHFSFFKSVEFNLISSYRAYLLSTENLKKILNLFYEVKIKMQDIVNRHHLDNEKFAPFYEKYKIIIENYIDELEFGIKASKESVDTRISQKSLYLSLFSILLSIIFFCITIIYGI